MRVALFRDALFRDTLFRDTHIYQSVWRGWGWGAFRELAGSSGLLASLFARLSVHLPAHGDDDEA